MLVAAGSRVDAVDAGTGTLAWRYQASDFVWSSLTARQGIVYVGTDDGGLDALNASGERIWRQVVGTDAVMSVTVAGGIAYVGSYDEHLYALDASSGEQLWKYKTDRPVASVPTVRDEIVYVGSFADRLYALDARRGHLLWEEPVLVGRADPGSHLPWSSPGRNGTVRCTWGPTTDTCTQWLHLHVASSRPGRT